MGSDPRALLQQAEQALRGASSGWSIFGDRSEKYENAVKLFENAGNAFRLQKLYKEAGQAFERAAQVQVTKLKEPDASILVLQEAFKAYRKGHPEDAARVQASLTERMMLNGAYSRAAMQQKDLAQMWEDVDSQKYEKDAPACALEASEHALAAHEKAAELFDENNSPMLAHKHYIKVAELSALKGNYNKASDILMKQVDVHIKNEPLKPSMPKFFLGAAICQVATFDPVTAYNQIQQYQTRDKDLKSIYSKPDIWPILQMMVESVENKREEDFIQQVKYLQQRISLDDWHLQVLEKVVHKLQEDEFS
ncbi:vesicular-fusion protein Sec17 [Aspergillus heterothallicus]